MHQCKTCYGEGVLIDNTPCPDCYLKVYKSKDTIQLCGNCHYSYGRIDMYCMLRGINVTYDYTCRAYRAKDKYISPRKRRLHKKYVKKIMVIYEKINRLQSETDST